MGEAAAGIVVVDRDRVRFKPSTRRGVGLRSRRLRPAVVPHTRRSTRSARPPGGPGRRSSRAPPPDPAPRSQSSSTRPLRPPRRAARSTPPADFWSRRRRPRRSATPAPRRRRGLEAARCDLAAGDTDRARSLLDRLVPLSKPRVRSRRRCCSSARSGRFSTPAEAVRLRVRRPRAGAAKPGAGVPHPLTA